MFSVDLPPEPASATRARVVAREQLGALCTADALDTVSLLVTELVTNGILHARTPLRLLIEANPGRVRVCVEDSSRLVPEVHRYGNDAVTGRGLAMVEQLASSWGVDATPAGKVVWCEIAI